MFSRKDPKITSEKSMKTIAYLRVSTIDQDLEKKKADILLLANKEQLGQVEGTVKPVLRLLSRFLCLYIISYACEIQSQFL
jgi:hypothetical protein